MFPEPLGAFSSLRECSGEGKQRLNQGMSPDLAPVLNVLQFGGTEVKYFSKNRGSFRTHLIQAQITTLTRQP